MGDGDGGGGLDFQAGIFQLQKIMAEARRRAKRAASSCRQLSPLRAGTLQKPISKEGKGNSKRKMGGAGWWRAALRLLKWESRDRCEENQRNTQIKTGEEENSKSQAKSKPAPTAPPGTLYFVSAEPYGTGRSRPRKRRAGWLRADQGVVGTGMGMMMLMTTTPYMSLQDLESVEDDGRSRIVALLSRPPPPPPIYWVT